MKAIKFLEAIAFAVVLFIGAPLSALAAPSVTTAISLRQLINNDAQSIRRIPQNEGPINTYLPQMGTCRPSFDKALTHLDLQIGYYNTYKTKQANGTLTSVEATALTSAMQSENQQVYNYTNLGYQCVVDYNAGRPPVAGDVYSASGVKYTVYGAPSASVANGIISTVNQLPVALRNKIQVAASTLSGWKFYIVHSPDDFKDSPVYAMTGLTDAARLAYFNNIRKLGAFTDGNLKIQVFFEYYYPTGSNTFSWVPGGTNMSAAIAHENEHLNDWRVGRPSQNDAIFNTYYQAGVAAYNAAAGHDLDIGTNFVTGGASKGKEELFAELGAYWDLQHMPGFAPTMASRAYAASEVSKYWSQAWTYFQQKKTAGVW